MHMIQMPVKCNDLLIKKVRGFSFIFATFSPKIFHALEIWDLVNFNLVVRVFKKPERSNHCAQRYNASKSRNAKIMSQLLLDVSMDPKLAKSV